MTYDRYIYIYENCTVRLASVGLAQARPNKYAHASFTHNAIYNDDCPEPVGLDFNTPEKLRRKDLFLQLLSCPSYPSDQTM